jgi:hypothetical protein
MLNWLPTIFPPSAGIVPARCFVDEATSTKTLELYPIRRHRFYTEWEEQVPPWYYRVPPGAKSYATNALPEAHTSLQTSTWSFWEPNFVTSAKKVIGW